MKRVCRTGQDLVRSGTTAAAMARARKGQNLTVYNSPANVEK